MRGLGDRMRSRARELGIADAEVARRAGLTQTRYANYVADRHEPDLQTLVRICVALEVTSDELLGVELAAESRPTLGALVESLDDSDRAMLSAVAEGLALRSSKRTNSR